MHVKLALAIQFKLNKQTNNNNSRKRNGIQRKTEAMSISMSVSNALMTQRVLAAAPLPFHPVSLVFFHFVFCISLLAIC